MIFLLALIAGCTGQGALPYTLIAAIVIGRRIREQREIRRWLAATT